MARIWKFAALLMAMAFFGAGTANAQATRTWVSGVGDDVNPCSRTAPCKTFAGAISKTAAGGEINCLDPGGFGTVTVTKSMTFDCTNTIGSVLASSTTGFIINGAGIIVNIRGITINGGTPTTPGVNGIRFLQGARVSVEDCVIFNFTGAAPNGFGILINNTSTNVQLDVRNTVIRNNGTATSGGGIGVIPTATGGARIGLENVQLTGNFRGLDVNTAGATAGSAGVRGSIHNAFVDNNVNGLSINGGTIGGLVTVVGSTVTNNSGTGINAGGSATAGFVVGSTTIQHNGTGLARAAGAAILTFGDNLLNVNLFTEGTFSGPASKS